MSPGRVFKNTLILVVVVVVVVIGSKANVCTADHSFLW